MAVSNVQIIVFPDAHVHSDEVLRPAYQVSWESGVGPFDVLHEWDTDSGFGSPITDNNTSVTSPDTGIPPSDMGPAGTTWYYQATVTDNDDSSTVTVPASGNWEVDFEDALDHNRYQYLVLNTGVAFSPIDDPKEVQLITHDGTGGTFTLSFSGQGPTSSLNWNATATQIKTALENLSNITTVDVRERPVAAGRQWSVRFLDPDGNVAEMTISSSITGGTFATIDTEQGGNDWGTTEGGTEATDGDAIEFNRYQALVVNVAVGFSPIDDPAEVQLLYHDGTGGTYTVSFDGQGPSGNIDWDDDGTGLESALEGFSNIAAIDLVKVNHPTLNAYRITFIDPTGSQPLITINATNLTGDTVATVVEVHDGNDWGVSEGGTDAPDGEAIEFNRYHAAVLSVGVGFDIIDRPLDGWSGNTALTEDSRSDPLVTGQTGPGDGFDLFFQRSLYHLLNITTTQPCPFVTSVTPTVAQEGDSLTIRGQGLVSATKPTTDAWGAEVRLYASQSFGASYVVMPIVDYTAGSTEDVIIVQVPTGATNGHVAVVHTTTPTCSGSNFTFVQIVALQANPDAGWWIQAWEIDATARIVAALPALTASFQKITSDIGSGQVELPAFIPDPADASANLLDSICRTDDDTDKVETLLRVYLDGVLRYAFFAHDRSAPYGEIGQQRVIVSGDGRESVMDWGVITAQDWPSSPIRSPSHIYGSSVNAVRNGGFEESSDPVSNGGIEDGITDPWASREGTSTTTPIGTNEVEVRTGGFSLAADISEAGHGVQQALSVKPFEHVFLEQWVKDNIGSGESLKFDAYYVNDEDTEVTITGTNASDTFTVGAPWHKTQIDFEVPEGITEVFMRLEQQGVPTVAYSIYVDDATGAHSISPWVANADAYVQLTQDQVAEGDYAITIDPSALYGRVENVFKVQPRTKYRLSVNVMGPVGEEVRLRANYGSFNLVDSDTFTGIGTWDTLTVEGTTGDTQESMRLGVESLEANGGLFYVDNAQAIPGEAAASPGTMVGDILGDIQSRGTLSFLQTNYSATVDSNGDAWLESALSLDIRHGTSFTRLLDRLVALGFGWEVTDSYEFRLVNKLGVDWTILGDEAPVISAGKALREGQIGGENPRATRFFAEGAGGQWTLGSKPEWETDLDQREHYIANSSAPDTTALGKVTDSAIANENARGQRLKLIMSRADDLRPFVNFDVGDSLWVDLPEEGIAKTKYRVMSITVRLDGEGTDVSYTLDLNRVEYEEAGAMAAALQRLLTAGTEGSLGPGQGIVGSPITGGDTAGGSIVSNPEPVPVIEHGHLFADISDAAAGGDLSGTFPTPLVVALRGRPIGITAPADGDALLWDDTAGLWTPGVAGGGGGGSTVPAWMELLAERPDTAQSGDDEFDDDSFSGWTQVTPSGSVTVTEKFGRASVEYLTLVADSDMIGFMKAHTFSVGDVIEICAELPLHDTTGAGYCMFGPIISDGTTTTDAVCMLMAWVTDNGEIKFDYRRGTFASMGSASEQKTWRQTPRIFLRLEYDAANTFIGSYSSDGVSWWTMASTTRTVTPTHFGWGYSTWGVASNAVLPMEYFRENPTY